MIAQMISNRPAYTIAKDEEKCSAELTLYGEVVSERPRDWEGNPIDGNFIVESEILNSLKELKGLKKLNIRLNSCGGECNTAIVIYNRLREMAFSGTEINCVVDGVAMSAGSHIMCAADKVSVSEGSLIMIHKSMSFACGYYNADALRQAAAANDAYDKAMLAAYKRRTKKSEEELLRMMSDETYMAGTEAVEHGFADELIESSDKVNIAASADKSSLIVNGQRLRLCGEKCPDCLPIAENVHSAFAKADDGNKSTAKEKGGTTYMAKNLTELKTENPELAAQIESEIKAQYAEENKVATDTAVQKALADERTRLEKIEAIAGQVSAEMLADAKYKHPCTAEELAYRAMSANAKQGAAFLADLEDDYSCSGTGAVKAIAPKSDVGTDNADVMRDTCAFIKQALGKENK